jgi:hypothetical protein
MVEWEYRTNPREASGLDPEAVHNEYGTAIRSQAEFDQLLEEIATEDAGSDETSFFVTPVDVHY